MIAMDKDTQIRVNIPYQSYKTRQHQPVKERLMRYGARNKITAKVTSVKRGDIMSLVKFEVTVPAQMASVLTTESAEELNLQEGDQVELIIKAIHVLPVKE